MLISVSQQVCRAAAVKEKKGLGIGFVSLIDKPKERKWARFNDVFDRS